MYLHRFRRNQGRQILLLRITNCINLAVVVILHMRAQDLPTQLRALVCEVSSEEQVVAALPQELHVILVRFQLLRQVVHLGERVVRTYVCMYYIAINNYHCRDFLA